MFNFGKTEALVSEALHYYKTIRDDIKTSLPFWPLGLSKFSDPWVSLGLKANRKNYIAIWRRNSEQDICSVPIEHLKGHTIRVKCAYPKNEDCEYSWNECAGTLSVRFSNQYSARLFEIQEL